MIGHRPGRPPDDEGRAQGPPNDEVVTQPPTNTNCSTEAAGTSEFYGNRRRGGGNSPGADSARVQQCENSSVEHRIPAGKILGLNGKLYPNQRFDATRRDRRIVTLRVMDGKTIRAIAAETGCSVGTVHRVLTAWGAT